MRNIYTWGLVTGFGLGCLYFLVPILIQSPQEGVESPRFEVVDNYKGCDVVRWGPSGYAEYKFFLDCRSLK